MSGDPKKGVPIEVINNNQEKEAKVELSPEMEFLLQDAANTSPSLDEIDNSAAREEIISRFANRHNIKNREAAQLLGSMGHSEQTKDGNEEDVEKQEVEIRERIDHCKKIITLVNDLRSTINVDVMKEKMDEFREENGNFDVSAIEKIIEESKNENGEHDIKYILRQLTELQEALKETFDQLEDQIRAEEDDDWLDDYNLEGKKREGSPSSNKKDEVVVTNKEERGKARQIEFITSFVAMFRQLKSENVDNINTFRDKLRRIFINPNVGTNRENFPQTKSLYDFVINYGDRNKNRNEKIQSLYNTFQEKENELDPYTFAREIMLYEGGGSYRGFIENDPTNKLQVYIK